MNNARFSSLIYRIIGKPERWDDDLEMMYQILDETESFDEPYNFSELAVGDRIISRIKQDSEALTVFNTLLDRSRFKMIILDENLKPIYHNKNAESLFNHILSPNDKEKVQPGLAKLIREISDASKVTNNRNLLALEYFDENGDQIYLRSIHSQVDGNPDVTQIHTLLVLDRSHEQNELNADLIAKYELTDKEQMVLRGLIHGKSIKEIAEESFISDNTVKTHLKAIFRKTDTNSQTSVVRLILTHESQILDSYFESEIGTAGGAEADSKDLEMVLSSGHKIAYCEYGPADGRPLIMCHSGYGCRLSVPHNHEEILQRTNRRLIIPDRSGTGKSPYIEGHPHGWNERLYEFITKLGIEEYDMLGSVLGSQMAINYAAGIEDDRLKRIILSSPVVINERSHTKYLTGIMSPGARLVQASKRFARELYELWLKSVTLNLDTHYRGMLENSSGSAEKELFEKTGTFELMVDIFKEGARHSLDGISNDMVFCIAPMKHDLSKIKVPIDVWYGTEDQRLSLEGVKTILEKLPTHTLHVREGYSEHIYFALFEEIIA
ncbi:MAG: alpha/beta fold hydrolase [Pseudomonadota bacterium]